MQSVANILPFLLIGGFSLSEIVAYLKAKLQAAKTVLTEIESTKEDHFIESAKQKSVNQPDKAMEKVN
jgi:hypothetical protein